MATYRFDELADGQAISFNPNTDVLLFEGEYSAQYVRATPDGANLRLSIVYLDKEVVLNNVSPLQVTSSNIQFVDGSKILFGDNTTGTANDNAANSLVGTSGNDNLAGFGGADTLNGGAGDDAYFVGAGDVIVDSAGFDLVVSDVSWTLGSGLEHLILAGTANISANGNNLNNSIDGNAGANYINARGGSDFILARGGNDTIDMSTGGTGLQGEDHIDGGDGIDTVDYDGYAVSGVHADLLNGLMLGGGGAGEGRATVFGVERLIGGGFADRIVGNSAANYLDGRAGNDTIDGGGGVDTLIGGSGADTFLFSTAAGAANAAR